MLELLDILHLNILFQGSPVGTEDDIRAAMSARLGIALPGPPHMIPGALPGYFPALPGKLGKIFLSYKPCLATMFESYTSVVQLNT